MQSFSLTHLADPMLRKGLLSWSGVRYSADAHELAHLAEFAERKSFLAEGYPSMHDFCVGVMGYSDDEAYTRTRVAQAARQFPAIYPLIQDRRLNQTAVLRLAPRLTKENAEELLSAAAGKTITQIAVLLAERFPRPDLVPQVRALSLESTASGLSLEGAGAQGGSRSQEPACELPSPFVSKRTECDAPRARVMPLSPQRFGIQLTVGEATHDKLRQAQALLGHAIPDGNLEQVLDRALDALIEKLEKKRFAATSQPRRGRASTSARHIPAAIRRAVRERDGGQCTFLSDAGHRCESRRQLEYDHVIPIAKGGESTAANLRLRCRAHNQYAAESAFGKGFMEAKRKGSIRRAVKMATREPVMPTPPRPAPVATEIQLAAALEVVPWLRDQPLLPVQYSGSSGSLVEPREVI